MGPIMFSAAIHPSSVHGKTNPELSEELGKAGFG